MFLTDDLLRISGPDARQVWNLPLRRITTVAADVAERWIVNVRIHPCRFRELVLVPFLEPHLTDDSMVLALCATRMRHAAPVWAPLSLGPASMNCAFHVACRDRRDGRTCLWVAERYTDQALAPAISQFGFPTVSGGLIDRGGPGRCLDISANDGLVRVQAQPGHGPDPELFGNAAALTAFVAAGVRSYAPGRGPGR